MIGVLTKYSTPFGDFFFEKGESAEGCVRAALRAAGAYDRVLKFDFSYQA